MSLKAVLILGPGIKASCLEDNFKRMITLYQKEGYLVVGDGIEYLTEQNLLSLKGKINSNTRIDIYAHGSYKLAFANASHYLHSFSSETTTSLFFKKLKNISSKALDLHLWSCSAKYALFDINSLPKKSVLTIHAGSEPSLIDFNTLLIERAIIKLQQSNLILSPFQSFLNNMAIESIQTSHLITRIGNKNYQFSIIPNTKEILEDSANFLNKTTFKFIEFYNKLPKEHKEDLGSVSFNENEINDFRIGSFIANCHNNYQIIENSKLLDNNTLSSSIINQNFNSITPLYAASMNGYVDIVELLIKHKVDVNQPDEYGTTPLSIASQKGHIKVVKLLLKYNADINKANNKGDTPLLVASKQDNVYLVELLLKYKANANASNKDGLTPLLTASQKGNIKAIELLLKYRADPNKTNKDGISPLFIASQNNHIKIIELLLKYGADINKTNKDGLTSLFIASYMGHKNVVELLLKCNAEIKDKTSVIKAAEHQNHFEITTLLKDFISGKIKYSPEACPSYHQDLEISVNGESVSDNYLY